MDAVKPADKPADKPDDKPDDKPVLPPAPPPDVAEMWLADAGRDIILLAVMQRVIKLLPNVDHALLYVADVRKGIPTTAIKMSHGVSKETHEVWMQYFGMPVLPLPTPERLALRKGLFDIWLHVIDRMLQAWANNQGKKAALNMFRSMMSEMLDHASKFLRAAEPSAMVVIDDGNADVNHNKELRIARANHNQLLEAYVRRRDGVYKMMQDIEATPTALSKVKMFSLSRMWNSMDDPSHESVSFCKDSDVEMARCRAGELARLRLFRQRMEETLAFEVPDPSTGTQRTKHFRLHRVQDHLFDLRTYRSLQDDIMEFVKANNENKNLRMKLLQKFFEREALVELHRRMLEMIDDVDTIKKHINPTNPPKKDYQSPMLKYVGNLEWACTRTWQEVFPVVDVGKHWKDANADKPTLGAMSPAAAEASAKANAEANIAGAAAAPKTPVGQLMGGGSDVSAAAGIAVVSANNMPNLAVAQVHQDIIAWQNLVRKVLDVLRGGIMEIITIGAPHMGSVGVFMHDAIVPRLRNVLKALDENVVRNYMSQQISADDDAQLGREERSRKIQMMKNANISPSDIMAYKFADTSVSLMYVLKGVRLLLQVVSLFAAQKIFSETYVSATSGGDRSNPPHMSSMLYTFLSIDATFQLFVLLILVLLSYLYKRQDNTYIIDDDFIMMFLVEYFVTTVTIGVLGAVFARLMRKKRYFEYATQGVGVIRSYRDVMIGTCAVVSCVPFFILF